MLTTQEIPALLQCLERVAADALEDQTLDFKEWIARSYKDSIALVLEAVICMANGGGGTLVIGVRDKIVGRASAIVGVPADLDINRLKRAIYDGTPCKYQRPDDYPRKPHLETAFSRATRCRIPRCFAGERSITYVPGDVGRRHRRATRREREAPARGRRPIRRAAAWEVRPDLLELPPVSRTPI